MSDDFDPTAELAALRERAAITRRRTYAQRRSRLDRYTGELLSLHHAGGTVAELQRWLRTRRVVVVHSTVARWLSKYDTRISS